MTVEDILVLTKEVAQQVPMLQGHPEDWFQQEWAAQAHHAVSQLWAWTGSHTKAWRLLAQCWKPSDEQDPTQVHFYHRSGVSRGAEASSVDSQGAAPRDTAESSAGTCAALPAIASTVTELGTAGRSAHLISHLSLLSSHQNFLCCVLC